MSDSNHFFFNFSLLKSKNKLVRIWNLLKLYFVKWEVKKEVIRAYRNRNSIAHKKISFSSDIFYGLNKNGDVLKEREFRNLIWIVMSDLFSERKIFDLGICNTGFDDIKIFARSDSVCEAWTYLQGFYDELTILYLYRDLIRSGDTVIDIGSNIGIHSLVLSKLVGESGQCIAYEPNDTVMKKFSKNMELNAIKNIRLIPTALGNYEGLITFNPEKDNFNQGVGHFDPSSKNYIRISTLDNDMKSRHCALSLIKIDVEGYELEVLKGAKKCVSTSKPYIIIEYNSPPWTLNDIRKVISYPFEIIRIPNTYWEKPVYIKNDSELSGYNNLLFVPDGKPIPLAFIGGNYGN